MSNTTRRLGSALAAITIASSTLIGLGLDTSTAHAAGAVEAAAAPSLKNVRVPASCGHPATRLEGYEKDYPRTDGHTTLAVAEAISGPLDRYRDDVTIVPLRCSAHGKAWPDLLLVYGARKKLVATFRMRTALPGVAHATISDLDFGNRIEQDGYAYLSVTTSNADGYLQGQYEASIAANRRTVTFLGAGLLTIDGIPAGATPGKVPMIKGKNQSYKLKPAPAGLRAFLQTQSNKLDLHMTLERYSHRYSGFALVKLTPGDTEERVAARIRTHSGRKWQWIATYWDRSVPTYACDNGDADSGATYELNRTTRPAWTALGLDCVDSDGSTTTLASWPESGR